MQFTEKMCFDLRRFGTIIPGEDSSPLDGSKNIAKQKCVFRFDFLPRCALVALSGGRRTADSVELCRVAFGSCSWRFCVTVIQLSVSHASSLLVTVTELNWRLPLVSSGCDSVWKFYLSVCPLSLNGNDTHMHILVHFCEDKMDSLAPRPYHQECSLM